MTALILATLLAAPVPRPRERPPSPVGTWHCEWRGCRGVVTYCPDGSLVGGWGGQRWEGGWTMEGRTLRVCEWPADGVVRMHTIWRADLAPGTLQGTLAGGGAFRLERRGR